MLRAHNRLFHYGIVSCDLALIGGSLYAGSSFLLNPALLPHAEAPTTVGTLGLHAIPVILAWLFMAMRGGVYNSWRTGSRWREATVILEATLFAIAVGTVASLAIWGFVVYQPAVSLAYSFGTILALRLGVRLLLARARAHGRNYRRVLIVGRSRSVHEVISRIEDSPTFGLRLVGGVHLPGEEGIPSPHSLDDLGSSANLCDIVATQNVDRVLICPSSQAMPGAVQRAMDLCDEAGIRCAYVPNFLASRSVHAEAASIGDLPLFSFSSVPSPSFQLAVKRLMDVCGAMAGIILTLPVQLISAIGIKLADGGPILFKQERVGAGGRRFPCYKFRSMFVNADARKQELMALNEQDGPVFKIKKDPRITPIGRLLRKYSLDELPQLYNVLLGDMSLVGPRPPVPDEVSRYEWWQRKRISVRPGITCIWQVWGRNKVSFKRWVEMDLYYIDNWSLWLDVKLLLHTVRTVVRGTGS